MMKIISSTMQFLHFMDLNQLDPMSFKIQRVNYFHITVRDQPGEAYLLLERLADQGVNLLAFSSSPIGPTSTQLTIFPENKQNLEALAKKIGLSLIGPFPAFIVNGSDELGALTYIHKLLYMAKVNVYATSGVTDGHDSYGYLIYVRQEDFERAAEALGI